MSTEQFSGPERWAHFCATLVDLRKAGVALPADFVELVAADHGLPSPMMPGEDTPEGRAVMQARSEARSLAAARVVAEEVSRSKAALERSNQATVRNLEAVLGEVNSLRAEVRVLRDELVSEQAIVRANPAAAQAVIAARAKARAAEYDAAFERAREGDNEALAKLTRDDQVAIHRGRAQHAAKRWVR